VVVVGVEVVAVTGSLVGVCSTVEVVAAGSGETVVDVTGVAAPDVDVASDPPTQAEQATPSTVTRMVHRIAGFIRRSR
jgi:hypothetical protein